jgi:hypothetical protein
MKKSLFRQKKDLKILFRPPMEDIACPDLFFMGPPITNILPIGSRNN